MMMVLNILVLGCYISISLSWAFGLFRAYNKFQNGDSIFESVFDGVRLFIYINIVSFVSLFLLFYITRD